MAAIDKTYTNSFKEYTDLIVWARNNKFKCPNGMVLNPYNYVYSYWSEDDFDGSERPVMNTSWSMDYFLIKYCPLEFVQERMREVYDKEYYNSIKNGTSPFDTFSKEGKYGRHCKIVRKPDIITTKPWDYKTWWVQLKTPEEYPYIMYNSYKDKWLWPYELGNAWNSTCDHLKSLKSVIRHILKWQLPIGTIVKVTSRYVGIDWEIKVTK